MAPKRGASTREYGTAEVARKRIHQMKEHVISQATWDTYFPRMVDFITWLDVMHPEILSADFRKGTFLFLLVRFDLL